MFDSTAKMQCKGLTKAQPHGYIKGAQTFPDSINNAVNVWIVSPTYNSLPTGADASLTMSCLMLHVSKGFEIDILTQEKTTVITLTDDLKTS